MMTDDELREIADRLESELDWTQSNTTKACWSLLVQILREEAEDLERKSE
jgi:hypothetical protein